MSVINIGGNFYPVEVTSHIDNATELFGYDSPYNVYHILPQKMAIISFTLNNGSISNYENFIRIVWKQGDKYSPVQLLTWNNSTGFTILNAVVGFREGIEDLSMVLKYIEFFLMPKE